MAKSKKSEPAIEIKNITKEFVLPKYQNDSLKQLIVHGFKRNEKTKHTVLKDISFAINKGDFFGIVGRNGSGKSTLLKLICGIYAPTSGEIITHGKITPFIELGVGFNPELSGRDNVYLNGALLGFNRKKMREMYDEIVKFAELEEFMDLKLKNYSSGMQVRLAFSIAIKAKNDILIFDEVLAVGDEAFQRKCIDVFEKYKADRQTVVLVTHAMDTVKQFCNRAALIDDSGLKKIGSPVAVAEAYSLLNQAQTDKALKVATTFCNDVDISLFGSNLKKPKASFDVGEPINIIVNWPSDLRIKNIMIDLMRRSGGIVTNFMSNRPSRTQDGFALPSDGVRLAIDPMLGPGSYCFCLNFYDDKAKRMFGGFAEIDFVIKPNWNRVGHIWSGDTYFEHSWKEIKIK